MNLSELRPLIASGESSTLELKKSTAEKERACRTLCGFANGDGGLVVFGVTPAGKILGQSVSDRTFEELATEFNGFEPPLLPRTGWETQAATDWTIDKLDHNEIVVTLEESIRRGRSDDPGSRDPLAILRGFGLLTPGHELTRAAVALFCKGGIVQPDFPQLHLRLARFKGVDRSEFLDNRQFHGNAFDLMRRAERFLIDWLPVASRIVPGKFEREDVPLFPIEALREALANAFVHRDYASGSGSIGVALYDDRLEIISPGELHFGLTPAKLLLPHESKPWNPLIASAFYRRGITEKWGRGTLKIVELMVAAGQRAPALVSDDEFVMVTFTRPDQGAMNRRTPQVTPQVMALLQAATQEVSRHELMDALNLKDRMHFSNSYLTPALSANLIEMTLPDKPNSAKQKYRRTAQGQAVLREAQP